MLVTDVDTARFNMVEQQVRPWNVIDGKVLSVMQQLPREAFVPDEYTGLAYADIEVPIGHGHTMMFPRLEARMMQSLGIKPSDRVLEIGTGSGYVCACLAKLARTVTTIDIHEDLSEQAQKRASAQGIDNVIFKTGNAFEAMLGDKSFDCIAVTGSIPQYEDQFQDLLTQGGRMFVVTGEDPVMEATLITRVGGDLFRKEAIFETELEALEGVCQPEHFSF